MVRKWSYLTLNTDFNSTLNFENITKCYTFKVFRMTTRFKKYNRYDTRFIRKKDSMRKRQTSWINLSIILAQWALYFLKSKQYFKFYQNINLYKYQYNISDIIILKKKHLLLNNNLVFNTGVLSKKFTNLFTSKNQQNRLSQVFLYSNNFDTKTFKETNITQVSLLNESYSYQSITKLLNNQLNNDFNLLGFNLVINQISTFYKILILLTLINTIK